MSAKMARPYQIQTDNPQTEETVPSMVQQLMQHPLLARDKEIDLARRARAGEDAARRQLAESNLRLVCNIARKYQVTGIAFEDLVQEGTIGLMRAIDLYNPEMGWKFSTYAVFWIRQSIGKALSQRSRVIRLPAHVLEASKRISKYRTNFIAKNGRPPTEEELTADLKLSLDKLRLIENTDIDCVSLETGRDEVWDYTNVLQDERCTDPEDAAIKALGKDELARLLGKLSDRERTVILKRLSISGEMPHKVLQELANQLGVSPERVRQIERRAILSLRQLVSSIEAPAIEAILREVS